MGDILKEQAVRELETDGWEVLTTGFPDVIARKTRDGKPTFFTREMKNLSTGDRPSKEQLKMAAWLNELGIRHEITYSHPLVNEDTDGTEPETRVICEPGELPRVIRAKLAPGFYGYTTQDGASLRIRIDENGTTLLKNSILRKQETENLQDRRPLIVAQRDEWIKNGVLTAEGSFLRLVQDVNVTSPTRAACIGLGAFRSSTVWKPE